AYAPHLRKSPLVGVPAKSMIVQFAKGDTNQLNPTTTALLRAGDLADRATFYRHDLAFAEDPTLDRSPHQFLIRVVDNPGERRIALAYQSQIAAFFASDGQEVIHPEPARFFEVPIEGPLPEGLNYIQPPGPRRAAAPLLGSPSVAGTAAAASRSGTSFADLGISAATAGWAAVAALPTAWARAQSLLPPWIHTPVPSQQPAP